MNKVCKICGFKTNSSNGFGYHIRMKHNISAEEYYVQYIIDSHDKGKCVVCGKDALFKGINIGYSLFCSKSCSKKGEYNPCYGKEPTHKFKKGVSSWNKGIPTTELSKQRRKNTINNKKYNCPGSDYFIPWNKGLKIPYKSRPERRGIPPWNLGIKRPFKRLSDVHKLNIRISTIKRLEQNVGQICPRYNPDGCRCLDKIMLETNTFIQHAENGGEFHIKELGYWVDGYDKENNIVYEYDEKHHFNIDGSLCDRDIRRQKEIEEFLGCKFIRMSE